MSRIKLLDQSGKPATFDLMQTADGGHNLLITGAPGSGKTTLTTMLVTSAAVRGHYVRIVTTGNRYRETTEAHHGVCQECSVFRPFSLNPFSSVVDWNQDRLGVNAVYAAIIRQAAGSGNDLLPAILELSQKAVSKAWVTHFHQADITHVYTALSSFDGVPLKVQYAAEAALQPFLPGEVYENWFDGPALDLKEWPFVTFNLENLMIVAPLYRALVPALLHLFGTDAARGSVSPTRLILIESLWQLHVPTATMTALLRHGTGANAAIVITLDSFDDLRHMTIGKIVTANCHHRVFFSSPAMSFNYNAFIEGGIPETVLDLLDSPEGRRRHLFYLTTLNGTYALDATDPTGTS
jgi:hypothetical protein